MTERTYLKLNTMWARTIWPLNFYYRTIKASSKLQYSYNSILATSSPPPSEDKRRVTKEEGWGCTSAEGSWTAACRWGTSTSPPSLPRARRSSTSTSKGREGKLSKRQSQDSTQEGGGGQKCWQWLRQQLRRQCTSTWNDGSHHCNPPLVRWPLASYPPTPPWTPASFLVNEL